MTAFKSINRSPNRQGANQAQRQTHRRKCAVLPLVIIIAAAGAGAAANPRGAARGIVGGAEIQITYGRPWVRGRDLLQWIEPGQLWRLGADAPTTIQSAATLNFGGTLVPPGKHILLVRYIAPGSWSLVVSSQPAIRYTPQDRVAEAPAHLEKQNSPTEQLTLRILSERSQGRIEIAWGRYRLTVPFSIAKP